MAMAFLSDQLQQFEKEKKSKRNVPSDGPAAKPVLP